MDEQVKECLLRLQATSEHMRKAYGATLDGDADYVDAGIYLIESLASQLEASRKDAERLDKLQSLTRGYGRGWLLRDSTSGRGMRLHETSQDGTSPTVREAIDAYKLTPFDSALHPQREQDGGLIKKSRTLIDMIEKPE